jgi:hypothetical protein
MIILGNANSERECERQSESHEGTTSHVEAWKYMKKCSLPQHPRKKVTKVKMQPSVIRKCSGVAAVAAFGLQASPRRISPYSIS